MLELKEEKKDVVVEIFILEKIELFRAVSRKSFLRLGGNKKFRVFFRFFFFVKWIKFIIDSGGEL